MKLAVLTPVSRTDTLRASTPFHRILFRDTAPEWHDYRNRLMLLVDAASKGFDWVLWLDADESLADASRAVVQHHIQEACERGCIAVTYQVCEMWNETHYRTDGIWGRKRRVVLQKNPLMEESVHWRGNHLDKLHAFPIQCGDILDTDSKLLHWGMSTPTLRQERRDKYRKHDPDHRFQPVGYDYLLDESGIELKALETV